MARLGLRTIICASVRCLSRHYPNQKYHRYITSPSTSTQKPLRPVTEDDRKRIYIMGLTPDPIFIAGMLAHHSHPVTFLVENKDDFEHFQDEEGRIGIAFEGPNKEIEGKIFVDGVGMEFLPSEGRLCGAGLGSSKRTGKHLRFATTLDPLNDFDSRYLKLFPDRLEGSFESPAVRNEKKLRILQLDDTETRPIMNLICSLRDNSLGNAIAGITHRLGRDSNVCIFSRGMGVMENLVKSHFTPTASRPTLFHAWNGYPVAYEYDEPRNETLIDALKSYKRSGVDPRSYIFHIRARPFMTHSAPNQLFVSPIIHSLQDSPQDVIIRREHLTYILDALSKSFKTTYITQKQSVEFRMQKVVIKELIHLLAMEFECTNGDLLATQERRIVAVKLFQEAFEVIKGDFPSLKNVHTIAGWVSGALRNRPDYGIPGSLIDIYEGRELNLEFSSQWVVERGKQLNPPVRCPEHEKIMRNARRKSAIHKKRLADHLENELNRRHLLRKLNRPDFRNISHDANGPKEVTQLDKLDRKRLKKEERIKQILGKQEIPAYHRPNIQGLGNLTGPSPTAKSEKD